MESAWLAARLPRKGQARRVPCSLERGSTVIRRANAQRVRPQKGRPLMAGEDWTLEGSCPCVVVVVAETDRRRQAQRSVRFPFHPTG